MFEFIYISCLAVSCHVRLNISRFVVQADHHSDVDTHKFPIPAVLEQATTHLMVLFSQQQQWVKQSVFMHFMNNRGRKNINSAADVSKKKTH